MHIAFRKFLESNLVRGSDGELLFFIGQGLSEVVDIGLALTVPLLESLVLEVETPDLLSLLMVVLVGGLCGVDTRGACNNFGVLALDIFDELVEARVLVLEVDHLLAHLVSLLLPILDVALKSLVDLLGRLGLLHASLHVLHQLGQLSILFILLLKCK